MKKLLIILYLCLTTFYVHGQNKVHYTYSESGNRTERTILLSQKSVEETPEVFIEEYVERRIKIYPNPTQGQLKIEISDLGKDNSANLIIYDAQGKKVLLKKTTDNYTVMDLSSSLNGIYILHINIKGETSTWKIIKQ